MKIYRVVVEWPNRTNPIDRVYSELFESIEEARKHIAKQKEYQEVYGLEVGEEVRLEIYDSDPVFTEYNVTAED